MGQIGPCEKGYAFTFTKNLSGTRSQKEQEHITRIYAHAHLPGEYESTGGENLVALQAMKGGDRSGQQFSILNPAYNTVRRDLPFERCAEVLPDHIRAMISHTLQTLTVTTV